MFEQFEALRPGFVHLVYKPWGLPKNFQVFLNKKNHYCFPDADGQTFVEEVVVESVLQVRSPSSRQARTNTQTSLQDGARVAEAKIYH